MRLRVLLGPALALALGASGCHRGPTPPGGDVAATLTASPVGDHAFDPTSLHGKPALVMFVSPTCPYCVATIPRGAAAARATHANVVAIFTAGRAANAQGVVRYTHFPGTALVDDGTLVHRYHIKHVPYILVLGADGHARAAFVGEQEESTLQDALAAAD